MQDLVYGFRRIVHSPAFSAIVVATLALGIGANTALFSVIDAVLLRALPYAAPDRLVTVEHHYPSLNDLHAPVSVPGFRDYSGRAHVFESVAVEDGWGPNLTGLGEPQRLAGSLVTGRYFGTLGVPVAAGRPLVPGDDQPGHERVVVLSHGLAQRLLGGARNAVGRKLLLNGESYEVVGVVPASFHDFFAKNVEIWAPLVFKPEQFADSNRTNESLALTARLRPGVSVEQAQVEMRGFAEQLKRQYRDSYPPDWGLVVTSLSEKASGKVRVMLLVLLGAVGFVLLIACTNVANLLLARAAGRAREIAVRTALGATRWQLVRQLLIESLLLALAGGALGLALGAWALRAVAGVDPAGMAGLPLGELRLDGAVLLFTLGVSLATGLLFGLAPALATARADTQQTLKEGGRSVSAGRSGQAVRRGLVVAEIALALSLLICAGLLVKSFARLQEVKTGFNPQNLLTLRLALPTPQYKTEEEQRAFFDRTLARLAAVPGVRAVGATSVLPFGGNWSTSGFEIEGYVPPAKEPGPWGDVRRVSPGFFHALEVPLLRGRTFTEADGPDAVKVAVVDEEMVRRYWPHGDPIGKRLGFGAPPGKPHDWLTIVGVVGHTKHEGLDADPRVQLYLSYRQRATPGMTLALRTATEPLAALGGVRAALHEIDPGLPLSDVQTMTARVESSTQQRRYSTLLFGLFSGMALLLASLGIYGVMSYSVVQRSHELGVRMALGAARGQVLGLVLRQGMALALVGLGFGLLVALAGTRLLATQLFAVRATDPETFVLVTAILAGVALAANLLPAQRATRVDPVVALREE
ncbi:MAG TPA: ABC transporter permease [Thermoanaerobaculia bacterium]|nr:ABC transporter permease [Thermoanaerobaculia bacterium]